MYSGKDAATPYPTQWALNPNAYQNIDSSQVDWAALAQQWIAMKEAAAIVAVPPPPSMKPDEEGEAPMEVENLDNNSEGPTSSAEWNSNSWGGSWNQWGWGWSGPGSVESKMSADPAMSMPPMIDGYASAEAPAMSGYSSGGIPAPTFQHGYWTAPQVEQGSSRDNNHIRERRSKSKNRDSKPPRNQRAPREKPHVMPPIMEPIVMPTSTIDAAKRRQLPAWIREGLEKMEREKQRAIEREQEMKAREEAERKQKLLEEEELERMKAEAGGQPIMPAKSKFDSDSEGEEPDKEGQPAPSADREDVPNVQKMREERDSTLVQKSKEEILQEVMLAVRRSLTEILLEVTDHEIHTVSQDELARYNAVQASRLNAMKASKSKALASIASGLGLGAYESSSEESGNEDDPRDVSDQQLQDIIKRKRQEFERTSREIEAEVRRAELKEAGDEASTPVHATPEEPRRSRSSTTPPPLNSETPEKVPERRPSKDKRSNQKTNDKTDGIKKLDTILEEKPKKTSRRDRTPSPQQKSKLNSKETSSSSSSDSDDDSSSSSSSSESEPVKIEKDTKKRKRRSSSSSGSRKKIKRDRQKEKYKEEKNSKSKYDDHERSDKSKSRKKSEYRYKSSRDYDRHKDKHRDGSEEERPKKRSKRSRSISYESRSGRRRSRDRSEERSRRREKKSYDRESRRDRSYEKYDRYERSREYDRRRSRSGSHRHRR